MCLKCFIHAWIEMFACIKMFEHGSLQNESFLPMCSVMEQPDGVASTAYIVRYYCQLPRCLLGLCASVCLLGTTNRLFRICSFSKVLWTRRAARGWENSREGGMKHWHDKRIRLKDVCANRKTHLKQLQYLGNSQQPFCHHFETGFKSPGRILNLKQIVQNRPREKL